MDNATQSATDLTGSTIQSALAQPGGGAPKNNPSVQAGLDSMGTGAITNDQLSKQLGDFQKKGQDKEAQFNKEYGAIGNAKMPESQFHPPPQKEMTMLTSMMMVLGVLAGRNTMAPMTAGLNNLTAIMKGHQAGNDQIIAAQRDQFKENFDRAITKAKAINEEKKALLDKHKGDMAGLTEEYNIFKLQHGIVDSVAKEDMFRVAQTDKMIMNMDRMANAMMVATLKGDQSTQGKAPLIKLADGTIRKATQGELTLGLPAGASLAERAGNARATLGEERGAFQESNLRQANRDIDRLEKIGTNMPIAGDIHIDSDGVASAVGRFGVKGALSDEEQQLVAAAQLFAEASGHLSSGARLTQSAFQREIREFIPQPGDAPGVLAQKKANRENVLGAAKGVSGKTGDKLRAEQDARWSQQPSGAGHPQDIQDILKKY